MNDYGFGGIDGRDMAIRELEDRGAAYRQRIADLEAQVDRLWRAYMEYEDMYRPYRPEGQTDEDIRHGMHGLHPGDLAPVKGRGE